MYRILLSLLLCGAMLLSLAGCAAAPESAAAPGPESLPAATVPPDGNPEDVTCLGTYYVEEADGDAVVAAIGEATLTNRQLQVYYWMAVAACRQAEGAAAPDFSQSLDTQLEPVSSRSLTWQQYFLEQALAAWHSQQALLLESEMAVFPAEEAYQPDQEQREERMTGMPAAQYLYGWGEPYTINRLHQAYLDAIPETLADLAADRGFDSAPALAAAALGSDADTLAAYMELLNRAYMYFTEASYQISLADEDVEAYYQAHQEEIIAQGEKTVTLRQILLVPENAQRAEDGTVTASQADWEQCQLRAQSLVAQWQSAIQKTRYADKTIADVPQARFSELAHSDSDHEATRLSGGLYENLRRGQLEQALEDWCFDDLRQQGDYEILQSSRGLHIVYFVSAQWDWQAEAEAGLLQQRYQTLVEQAMEAHPMTVDYSAIQLEPVEDGGLLLQPRDLLYPDIAHERFPDIPLYLQQDYPEAKYGNYPLRTHGCGITSLAMLASYLLDEPISPAALGERYGYYCGLHGSELVLFDDTPAELGFQLQKRSSDWNEITAALENGQKVINLQYTGYWTRGGHFILLDSVTEEGRYVVRDSNLFAYGKITDHGIDSHTAGSIRAAGQFFWIYEPKVARSAVCVRCAEGGSADDLVSDYLCGRCQSATARRRGFLAGAAG